MHAAKLPPPQAGSGQDCATRSPPGRTQSPHLPDAESGARFRPPPGLLLRARKTLQTRLRSLPQEVIAKTRTARRCSKGVDGLSTSRSSAETLRIVSTDSASDVTSASTSGARDAIRAKNSRCARESSGASKSGTGKPLSGLRLLSVSSPANWKISARSAGAAFGKFRLVTAQQASQIGWRPLGEASCSGVTPASRSSPSVLPSARANPGRPATGAK